MTLTIPFDNSYARLPEAFHVRLEPARVAAPKLIAFNAGLAAELGIGGTEDPLLAAIFAGNTLPEGAEPLAQIYAGHQFGGFSPQLGDGRALLLGEVVDKAGVRRDIQLKGSGPTPFSRRGDGRAALGPVLREYLLSEAMHALGVPSTRALAAVRSGEDVYRETILPGAVFTRVAASHIRVGTFQLFASRQQYPELHQLFEYTRDRHYPEAKTPGEMLAAVCQRQAELVAHWMSLGFIHGVMNTDNCTLSGETIDYGPCAFMDQYHPDTVYSSIDQHGRYAYQAQADIIVWNMAQLATAMVPLVQDQEAAVAEFTEIINAMPNLIRGAWLTRFGFKLGIAAPAPEDARLIADLLHLMQAGGSDFTNTFRALAAGSARDEIADRGAYDPWHARWQERIAGDAGAAPRMRAANPAFIPRNHRVEQAIAAAMSGDESLFHHLGAVLARPYDDQPEAEDLRRPPLPGEVVRATFCGT
ncbi:protein adenylyltransferase SelO [Salipiger mangrovisoli]|uniref:Protein nucleotidyltransferase YdiU n=1 Tax=Salipiger mangrovisoli TaxID=2865933 RepID=A0ABR9X3I4_9RHOB|nr:YdiU family protein [Salipiger mangrovisoli]MBE9638091.1 YdiU family protein [Salipiger mangrovisoli]